jgi:hypothetical protein
LPKQRITKTSLIIPHGALISPFEIGFNPEVSESLNTDRLVVTDLNSMSALAMMHSAKVKEEVASQTLRYVADTKLW